MSDQITEKKLGKIAHVFVGVGGYQDSHLGIWFTLEGKCWGVCDGKGMWSPACIEHSSYCKWSEKDRSEAFADVMRYIDRLLHDAKVRKVEDLKGKPVEATFAGNILKSWRILTEVM